MTASLPLPPLEVLEVIRSVAKFNSTKMGWELLIPPDTTFENKHPELMKRQNLYWEAKQKQFVEMISNDIAPKRQRKKSQRESVSSDTMLSPKLRCNSVSEEDSDKKRKKLTGAKRTRHLSSSAQDATWCAGWLGYQIVVFSLAREVLAAECEWDSNMLWSSSWLSFKDGEWISWTLKYCF